MRVETNERYLGVQVRARAIVVLTRRDDLRVVDSQEQSGLLRVCVDRAVIPMRQVFGVLLRGSPTAMTTEQANNFLGPTLELFPGLREFTCPACLFFFTMREEQAMFSWLAEPTIHVGSPKLVYHTGANCVELTDAVLDDVVDRVVEWYDVIDPLPA